MSPPLVHINTFVQPQAKYTVDKVSKFFIICSFLLGVNRLPIISSKHVYTIPSIIYTFVLMCVLNFFGFDSVSLSIMSLNLVLHILCSFLGMFFWKRMRLYYSELCKFDICIGCRPITAQGSSKLVIQTCIINVLIALVFIVPNSLQILIKPVIYLLPMHAFVSFEVHYYGHLLNLLIPRLHLINYYMESSLTTTSDKRESSVLKHVTLFKYYNKESNCQMKKIMDHYYIIVESYRYLIDAIKWQVRKDFIKFQIIFCC